MSFSRNTNVLQRIGNIRFEPAIKNMKKLKIIIKKKIVNLLLASFMNKNTRLD